jgi:hypothetical protein
VEGWAALPLCFGSVSKAGAKELIQVREGKSSCQRILVMRVRYFANRGARVETGAPCFQRDGGKRSSRKPKNILRVSVNEKY